ncbi:prolyl oligopeptidase family serine peptidase [Dongia sp.]|uniref:S9 family peptidase n=1 Tax=Dongia sp. TaxID=1977262 RepID=UPI0037501B7D
MPVAPYGSWASPITSDLVTADAVRLDQVMLDGADIYWTESQPEKKGRYLIYRQRRDGAIEAVTPEDGPAWNVRTRAHEYGGGAFTVVDGVAIFSHYPDQCLYRQGPGEAPRAITPATDPAAALRYADGTVGRRRNAIFLVQEDHTSPGAVRNALVRVDLAGAMPPRIVASGHDFYAAPRLSPDGSQLAWLTWDHPNMPWVTTDLWLAEVAADGTLGAPKRIAGGPDEALFQPQWSPAGELYFVSDRDGGWWNLHRLRAGRVERVLPMEAEFGKPQWNFNMSTYGFAAADRLVCSYVKDGLWKLGSLDTGSGKLTEIATRFTEISQVRVGAGRVVFLGGSGSEPEALVALDLETGVERVIRTSAIVSDALRPYISTPEAIAFPTSGGEIAHAFYYPPASKDYSAPHGEKVPVLVKSHGGPTASSSHMLSLAVQYWTSRGFGLLDVNYRGSTGYGRAYRLRLEKAWGIVDVDDCAYGARHLVAARNADPQRLAIRGGSAGGYTTLRALTAVEKTFSAGASHYGVSDLAALARDTHKFESRYLDWLIGPYPEDEKIYAERSPINHIDQLTVPVIFFQGTEDEVVPPNQTQMMVDGLKDRNVPVGYLLFEGEQHGFRKAENIRRALDAELYFYAALLTRSGLRYL